jgi:DNA-binding NarL/FixJ family response regulator
MKPRLISPSATPLRQQELQKAARENLCRIAPVILPREPRFNGSSYLTPRELEVLSLLCEGLPNKLIGRRLDISAGTVKIHVGRILSELGVSSRLQAVVEAYRRGLVRDSGATVYEQAYAFGAVAEARQPRSLRVA